jgi:predicted transcriptional regulator of viral defense system
VNTLERATRRRPSFITFNAGVGRRSIARRVERGWLIPLHRGVYQVGPVAARYGSEMGAVLACGQGAALSHQSAAAIWGFMRAHEGEVHVTVTGDTRSRPGLRVHRTRSLKAAVHNGLPLTTPPAPSPISHEC